MRVQLISKHGVLTSVIESKVNEYLEAGYTLASCISETKEKTESKPVVKKKTVRKKEVL